MCAWQLGLRHLPVVRRPPEVVGLLTRKDLLQVRKREAGDHGPRRGCVGWWVVGTEMCNMCGCGCVTVIAKGWDDSKPDGTEVVR